MILNVTNKPTDNMHGKLFSKYRVSSIPRKMSMCLLKVSVLAIY